MVNVDLYRLLVPSILFSWLKTDPEWLHQKTMQSLHWLTQASVAESQSRAAIATGILTRLQQSYVCQDKRLQQKHWGLTFPNPVGLAAGFDKDGVAAPLWANFGFGFAELGTVTYHAQPGNPQPRLFRLMADQAVLNRMGFNNRGAADLADRLAQQWQHYQRQIPIGINLGKSKVTPLEAAVEDYLASFRLLKDLGDYFVVNVSSPNTPGLRSLQAIEQLQPILTTLQQENTTQKPLFVKIAPDLTWEDIAAVVDLARDCGLTCVIATNTTIQKEKLKTQILKETGHPITEEAGGISGAPLRDRATDVIRFIWQHTQGQFPIIGVGGIFTADDAWEKITAGATLVQLYTGWIYEGPGALRRINRGLLAHLQAQGLSHISEAVGLAHK